MTITLKQLRLKGACWEQADPFKAAFGEAVEVTMDNALKYADKFDWTWAAEHLLPAPAETAYWEATAPARKAYEEAMATARKAYEEAVAPVWKAYWEAMATAGKAYREAVATAGKAYREATAPVGKAYREAKATAFVNAAREAL
jgi:hypothetical protein